MKTWLTCVLTGAILLVGLVPLALWGIPSPSSGAKTQAVASEGSPAVTAAPESPAKPQPELSIPQPSVDLGILEPESSGAATFVVKNVGAAPLTLELGPTSCKCTVSRLSTPTIAPSEQGEVELQWHAAKEDGEYAHYAALFTNDPRNPSVQLKIYGHVRVELAASSPTVMFLNVVPGQTSTAETVIYSQLWKSFTLDGRELSPRGLVWTYQPADDETLQRLHARSGYRVRVTLPDDLDKGEFGGKITWNVAPDDSSSSPRDFSVDVAGSVLPRLNITGGRIDSRGIVTLGEAARGHRLAQTLLVKVRDQDPDLSVRDIVVSPEFLRVEIIPSGTEGQTQGLYQLRIEVPADAPACAYQWEDRELGEIKVLTDHARIPEIALKVRFTVTDLRSLAAP